MTPSPPPADVATEEVIIGAVLDGLAQYADLRDVLSTGDLYDPRHRLIWATIGAISSKGKQPAAREVAAELHASGHLDAAGGSAYLLGLLNAPAVGDVRALAGRIDRCHLRQLSRCLPNDR
jgi:replicative DNA helicase